MIGSGIYVYVEMQMAVKKIENDKYFDINMSIFVNNLDEGSEVYIEDFNKYTLACNPEPSPDCTKQFLWHIIKGKKTVSAEEVTP